MVTTLIEVPHVAEIGFDVDDKPEHPRQRWDPLQAIKLGLGGLGSRIRSRRLGGLPFHTLCGRVVPHVLLEHVVERQLCIVQRLMGAKHRVKRAFFAARDRFDHRQRRPARRLLASEGVKISKCAS
ncbi:hypothetical protein [Bradyrhizobium sp. SZCCHNR1039]|uniref:hypothetical protein n=1 Tax=Bradyrhizobium sp. SZCCHNR1039 TaxID=3057350 RepID=UPI0029160825|nr:hypothetical protein [Bradyrhizobium sp. SZCCHNR1039]